MIIANLHFYVANFRLIFLLCGYVSVFISQNSHLIDGDLGFAVGMLCTWNSLPDSLDKLTSLSNFQKHFKSYVAYSALWVVYFTYLFTGLS